LMAAIALGGLAAVIVVELVFEVATRSHCRAS
jgi:hypothetical protein